MSSSPLMKNMRGPSDVIPKVHIAQPFRRGRAGGQSGPRATVSWLGVSSGPLIRDQGGSQPRFSLAPRWVYAPSGGRGVLRRTSSWDLCGYRSAHPLPTQHGEMLGARRRASVPTGHPRRAEDGGVRARRKDPHVGAAGLDLHVGVLSRTTLPGACSTLCVVRKRPQKSSE
jgi:hypothetical protein